MKKKKVVAMLLAGGQGTRLMALTSKVAKPAVSFGSKYRIIDFTLSNCANSSIDTVGILTQYEPMVLNNYIGNGKSWDLDRYNGGAHILSPYQGRSAAGWYKGTANAVFQNLQFLDKYDSEHVLILSGDHIYKMDYSIMLASHIKNNADCTIAVIGVGREEASRFGIMSYDSELRITDFEEKPKHPKSDRASMGVYIFKKDVLVQELTEDDKTAGSSNDFGKNIIPKMLKEGARMFAYPFEGYWKDVGTVESLWSANMDLLGANPQMDLRCEHMRVYANNEALPPCFITDGGEVKNSLVTAGCEIGGRLENCVVSENVTVGEGSVIKNSILMRGSVVGSNVKMDYCIVDEYTRIGDGCVIGEGGNKESIVLVGSGCVVKGGTVLKPGVVVE